MAKIAPGTTQDADREIVDRAKSGDREALGELFVRHAQSVRRLLASVVGVGDDLDDLVQEVFIQVHRSLPGFRGDARFSTWLHQVTVYAAYNYLRKPRRRWVATDPDVFASIPTRECDGPLAKWRSKETLRRLQEVLDSIKPKKRVAFILFAVEGYSVGEVSAMVGAPVATVKSRIWFARRELRKKARRDPFLGSLLGEMVLEEDDGE